MAIWEKATLTGGQTTGARVDVDLGGTSWVKILSPSFRKNDGTDFAYLNIGAKVIVST